jgi:hypothetical protein
MTYPHVKTVNEHISSTIPRHQEALLLWLLLSSRPRVQARANPNAHESLARVSLLFHRLQQGSISNNVSKGGSVET